MSSFQLTAPRGSHNVLRSVPLIIRGAEYPKLVLCEGHKLVARGSASRGVSFLAKYLLFKGYRGASVLFVDSTYTFGDGPENLSQKWNEYGVLVQQVEYGDVFSEQLLSEGIKNVRLPLELEKDERRLINFLLNLFEHVAQLPATKTSRVFILERFWFDVLAYPALWESLNYLLKVGRKVGLEIWLLCPSDIYDETRDEARLQRLQRLQTQIPNLFLLDHRVSIRYPFLLDVQSIWQLTPSEYDLLTSVGDDLSPALMPYKEVFFKRCIGTESTSEIYGIKVTEQEAGLF